LVSFVLLVLPTVLDIFHTVMKTATLHIQQWLVCTAVALSIVAAAEIRKAVLRRSAAKPPSPQAALRAVRPTGRSHCPERPCA